MAAENSFFTIDYPAYLSRHDVVFDSPPDEGWEGLPIGNGKMGDHRQETRFLT